MRVSIIDLQHCSKMSSQPPIKSAILSTMKTQKCANSGEVRYGTNELRLLSWRKDGGGGRVYPKRKVYTRRNGVCCFKKTYQLDLDFCFVVKLVNLNNVWFSHSYLCQLLFNFYLWWDFYLVFFICKILVMSICVCFFIVIELFSLRLV